MRAHRSLCILVVAALAGGRLAAAEPKPTVIDSDEMTSQSSGADTVSIFDGHVHVDATNLDLDCDHLKIVSARVSDTNAPIGQPNGLKYMLATGHVHITQAGGAREAFCGSAELLPDKDEIVLRDHPVVVDHHENTTMRGEWIEVFRGQERVLVHHVHAVGPPMKDLGFSMNPDHAPAGPSAAAPASPAPGAAAPRPAPPP